MPDRIEREVEELLAGLDQFPLKKPLRRRVGDAINAPFRAVSGALQGLHIPRINPGHLLLAAITILVVAYVVGGGTTLWNIVIAVGIGLFVLAFILSLRRQSRPPTRYWRDRPMDVGRDEGRSWWDRWRKRS
jgi:hypothetical protein